MKKIFIVCIVLLLIYAIAFGKGEADKNISFISQYGWIIDEESKECEALLIPLPLNDVYEKYNEIQKEGGFDLSHYCGKKAMRYTYRVLNHKAGEGVFVNLIVYEGKVIGADIMQRELGGFMHGINRKEFINAS